MKLKITLTKSPISSLQKHIDTVKATLDGLANLRSAEQVAQMRGKTVEEILD